MDAPGSTATAWHRLRSAWVSAGMVVLGFFLPMSTAGISLGLLMLMAAGLTMLPSLWRTKPWQEPVVMLGLALFAYIALHTLWMGWNATEPPGASPMKTVGRYQELWRAPVILALFLVLGKSHLFWKSLMWGAGAYAALHWLAWAGITPLGPEFLASRRIAAGLVLAAVAWLALDQAAAAPNPWTLRAFSAFLAATLVFAVDGRTGHLILLALSAWAGWVHAPKRWRWACSLLFAGLVALGALNSKAVQSRLDDTVSGIRPQAAEVEISSAGIRRDLYLLGGELALAQPWTGVGYAYIPNRFHEALLDKLKSDSAWEPLSKTTFVQPNNLHNEYLQQLLSGGIPAFALFILWLAAPLWTRGLKRRRQPAVTALVLAFSIGCLVNSWLMDFSEGHTYTVLLAWLLARNGPAASPEGQVLSTPPQKAGLPA